MLERPKRRLNFLVLVFAALCLLTLAQLARIQVLMYQELSDEGQDLRTRESDLTPLRGCISDRNGHLLAGNVVQYDISAAPALISDRVKTAATLALYLNMDAAELLEKLSSDELWVLIKRGVSQKIGDQIAAREMVGITIEPVWRRVYPEGELAAHLLGFVSAEGRGYYGKATMMKCYAVGLERASINAIPGIRSFHWDWPMTIPPSRASIWCLRWIAPSRLWLRKSWRWR